MPRAAERDAVMSVRLCVRGGVTENCRKEQRRRAHCDGAGMSRRRSGAWEHRALRMNALERSIGIVRLIRCVHGAVVRATFPAAGGQAGGGVRNQSGADQRIAEQGQQEYCGCAQHRNDYTP